MKKIVCFLVLLLVLLGCSPLTLKQPKIKCIDGDTFWLNDEKIRLLAVDAPEMRPKKEEYAQEATDLVCDLLHQADEISLKSDYGNERDHYDRALYWVYVDGELIQKRLLEEGLAVIKYVDKDTVDPINYLLIKKAELHAKIEGRAIWR